MYKRQIFSFVIIIGFIFLCTFPSHVQANDTAVGCCEKTEIAAPHNVTTMPSTKATCDLTGQQGPWNVVFKPDHIANANKCDKKITTNEQGEAEPIFFKPTVSIPDSKYIAGQDVKIEESTSALANYIVAIFKYSTGVIGIIAAIVLMIAGIMWLTAAGNQEQIGSAKKMLGGGLMGLVLTLGSFVILSMVNTNLVNLKITPVTKIENIPIGDYGCCKKGSNTPIGAYTSENLGENECNILKEQVGNQDDQYFSIEFFPMATAKDNDCVIEKGCCFVESVDSWIHLGKTLSATCVQNTLNSICEEKSTGWLKNWIPLGTYFSPDRINTSFFQGKKCEELTECTGENVIIQ